MRPTHRQIRDADGRNVGKVVDGVVEKRDRMTENAADDFGADETQSGDHGPAEDAGAERSDVRGRWWL